MSSPQQQSGAAWNQPSLATSPLASYQGAVAGGMHGVPPPFPGYSCPAPQGYGTVPAACDHNGSIRSSQATESHVRNTFDVAGQFVNPGGSGEGKMHLNLSARPSGAGHAHQGPEAGRPDGANRFSPFVATWGSNVRHSHHQRQPTEPEHHLRSQPVTYGGEAKCGRCSMHCSPPLRGHHYHHHHHHNTKQGPAFSCHYLDGHRVESGLSTDTSRSDTSSSSSSSSSDEEDACQSMRQLSAYQVDRIDEILASAAREIGLSTTEHQALKMDLFRNYVRTYTALKDAIEDQQLQCILHPILAEIVAKNVYEMDEYILDSGTHGLTSCLHMPYIPETADAPETIRNVPRFRHGAVFVHRCVLVQSDKAKIACTYALDVPKKMKVSELTRHLAGLFGTPGDLLRICFDGRLISVNPNDTLEALGIAPGDAVEAYCLTDTAEHLVGTMSSMVTLEPHISIREAMKALKMKKKPSRWRRGVSVRERRGYFCEDVDTTTGSDSVRDAVPTMAAMERLAKTFDSEAREGVGKKGRSRRPVAHACTCDCAICGARPGTYVERFPNVDATS